MGLSNGRVAAGECSGSYPTSRRASYRNAPGLYQLTSAWGYCVPRR